MPTFLATLAQQLYRQHGNALQNLTVVFPNKRAGVFFQQYLAQAISKPIFSPKIISIETLVQQLSKLQIASHTTLVAQLYATCQQCQPHAETFDRFYAWGAMLLHDFDEIDKYLVPAHQLFANLSDQKALEQPDAFLTQAQKTVIRSFWKTFGNRLSSQQRDFLQLWEVLPNIYQTFRLHLTTQNRAYAGLCYSKVCAALDDNTCEIADQALAFVGFNALSLAEEKIFKGLRAHIPTHFYWDIDAYYMHHVHQEAGMYLRAYQQQPTFCKSFVKPYPNYLKNIAKNIEIVAVATSVGQTQVVSQRLQALLSNLHVPLEKTAIVLADEKLLLPLLHALPAQVEKINVTMGYPLKATPLYGLLENLLIMQTEASPTQQQLPAQRVMAVLRHPYSLTAKKALAQQHIRRIQQAKSSYVAQKSLTQSNALYAVLFYILRQNDNPLDYLINCLWALKTHGKAKNEKKLAFDQTVLDHLYTQCRQLKTILPAQGKLPLKNFIRLFQQLIQPMRIPFQSALHQGLQIMGVLETRTLDFENLFILSMNEGIFPTKALQHSFIPYNLRKGYGLPTFDTHQDAVYAYHFYRLLQRAKNICITYHSTSTAEGKGEMSRYLWQLLYESGLPIKKTVVANPVHFSKKQPIVIQKTQPILAKLNQFLVHKGQAKKRLTPSAINTYIDCSLRFYFRYIAGLKEQEKYREDIGPALFGSLLHQTMEALYTQHLQASKNSLIAAQDFEKLNKNLAGVIAKVFQQASYAQATPISLQKGQHAVVQGVIARLATQILKIDRAYAPFEMIGLEIGRHAPLEADLSLNATQTIGLAGIIDRVDVKHNTVRVLDYKTGQDERKIGTLEGLFATQTKKRNKAALQALFYAWLFKQNFDQPAYAIFPAMMNSREIFNKNFEPRFLIKSSAERNAAYSVINNMTTYTPIFEAELRKTLTALNNPALPFVQTTDTSRCSACPYKGICQIPA